MLRATRVQFATRLLMWHSRDEGRNQNFYKNITPFILSWSQSFCGERQTYGGRRMETAILTHNFSTWPSTTLCYLQGPTERYFCFSVGREVFNRRLAVGYCVRRCHSGTPSHSLALSVTDRISSGRKLRLTQDRDSPFVAWAFAYMIS